MISTTIFKTAAAMSIVTASIIYSVAQRYFTAKSADEEETDPAEPTTWTPSPLPEFLDSPLLRNQQRKRKQLHDLEEDIFWNERKDRSMFKRKVRNEDEDDERFIIQLQNESFHRRMSHFLFYRTLPLEVIASINVKSTLNRGFSSSVRDLVRRRYIRGLKQAVSSSIGSRTACIKPSFCYVATGPSQQELDEMMKDEQKELERNCLGREIITLPSACQIFNRSSAMDVNGGQGLIL